MSENLPPPNHNEAWSLAHLRSQTSNLARCYIELRQVALKFEINLAYDSPEREALKAIVHANDL